MKIYTRSGDGGETDLPGGGRVWKNSPRLDACGTIDELSAMLGLARAENLPEDVDRLLERLQHELFNAGSELATAAPAKSSSPTISQQHVEAIEQIIDQYESQLPPLKDFIIPGGVRSAALCHVARTICRRAERKLVALVQADRQGISKSMLAYINRLGDLLFVLARLLNARSGKADTTWKKS